MAKKRGGTLIQRSRRVSPSAKAAFHELTGAGRSKVRRPFFGLDEQDAEAIVQRVEKGVDAALKESA